MKLFAKKKFSIVFYGVMTAGLVGLALFSDKQAARADSSLSERLVTIYDRDEKKVIRTAATTVSEVLDIAKIDLSPNDKVEPSLHETIGERDFYINIYRARPVLVVDGANRIKVMTSNQTTNEIALAAGINLHEEDEAELVASNNLVETGVNTELTIKRSKVVNLLFYGSQLSLRTQAVTVGEFLQERQIGLDSNDFVSLPNYQLITDGVNLEIWRNGTTITTVEEAIDFTVEQTRDYDQEKGFKEIIEPGEKGTKTVTYEVEMIDGKEVGRRIIGEVVTSPAKMQREVIGAKVNNVSTTASENERIAWNYFLGQGFSKEQTAGIMGNLMQEHRFNTDGDGLAQWTGSRKQRLLEKSDPYNIYTQLDFIMEELNGAYISVKNAILATNSISQATVLFQNGYEKCGVCREDLRLQYASSLFAAYG